MSITAENGMVVWRMKPNFAKKIARALRVSPNTNPRAVEPGRLERTATEAERQDATG